MVGQDFQSFNVPLDCDNILSGPVYGGLDQYQWRCRQILPQNIHNTGEDLKLEYKSLPIFLPSRHLQSALACIICFNPAPLYNNIEDINYIGIKRMMHFHASILSPT
ncbi:MAG: hypothetical protein U0T81_03770 [Saprospiraceae bacterium]